MGNSGCGTSDGIGSGVCPQTKPLTFLHLSDIHFRHRQGSAQFDLDAQLRKPLLDDIKSKPAEGMDYDGLFISGDIAFSGKKEEYDRAKLWLNEVYSDTGVLPERTYVVPGNHDVNRNMVVPDGAIWNNHAALRRTDDRISRRQLLQTQLSRDPACDPLSPLEHYNEFAQGYGCRTEKDGLAWVEVFPLPLNDGSTLRLHGLNSALNSDEGDDVANLYVSPFQTQHFTRDPDMTDLVLCHHPPHWLLDRMEIEGAFKSFARVALFGHEHNHRLQRVENTVQLFAGAVHPAARDPDWLPTYHILQLHVEGSGTNRKLVVKIYSRELRALAYKFVPRMSEEGKVFEERKVDLLEWRPPDRIAVAVTSQSGVSCSQVKTSDNKQSNEAAFARGFRELLVHFHRLSTPVRYKIATQLKLLRDGDDFPPQQQWDLVFKRAQEEEKLANLWNAVAENDVSFARRTNPFG